MVRRRGFTLIELLVVIALISILLALMSPTFRGTMVRGQTTQCAKHMQAILIAWATYPNEHKMIVSSANTGNHGCVNNCPAPVHFTCPHPCADGCPSRELCHWRDCWVASGHYGNSRQSIEKGTLYPYINEVSPYRCPTPVYDYYSSYSFNGMLRGEGGMGASIEMLVNILNPSQCMALMEDDDFRGYNMNSWMVSSGEGTWIDYVGGNHNNGDNVGFCDGRVEYWQWQDPDTLTFPYPPGSSDPNARGFGYRDPGSVDVAHVQSVFWPRL